MIPGWPSCCWPIPEDSPEAPEADTRQDHFVLFLFNETGQSVTGQSFPFLIDRLARRIADADMHAELPNGIPHLTYSQLNTEDGRRFGLLVKHRGNGLQRMFSQSDPRLISFIFGWLFSALMAYMVARYVIVPVRRLRQAGQRMAAGGLIGPCGGEHGTAQRRYCGLGS